MMGTTILATGDTLHANAMAAPLLEKEVREGGKDPNLSMCVERDKSYQFLCIPYDHIFALPSDFGFCGGSSLFLHPSAF